MNILWMSEDELREFCWLLMACVARAEELRSVCVNEALQHGYREGYTDGALQLPSAVEAGDGAGLVLH